MLDVYNIWKDSNAAAKNTPSSRRKALTAIEIINKYKNSINDSEKSEVLQDIYYLYSHDCLNEASVDDIIISIIIENLKSQYEALIVASIRCISIMIQENSCHSENLTTELILEILQLLVSENDSLMCHALELAEVCTKSNKFANLVFENYNIEFFFNTALNYEDDTIISWSINCVIGFIYNNLIEHEYFPYIIENLNQIFLKIYQNDNCRHPKALGSVLITCCYIASNESTHQFIENSVIINSLPKFVNSTSSNISYLSLCAIYSMITYNFSFEDESLPIYIFDALHMNSAKVQTISLKTLSILIQKNPFAGQILIADYGILELCSQLYAQRIYNTNYNIIQLISVLVDTNLEYFINFIDEIDFINDILEFSLPCNNDLKIKALHIFHILMNFNTSFSQFIKEDVVEDYLQCEDDEVSQCAKSILDMIS